MERLQKLNSQFTSTPASYNAGKLGPKSPDDVVIVSYARTAMTRAKKGPQANTAPESMLKPVLIDVLKKGKVSDPKMIEEICVGNVLMPGAGTTAVRAAQFLAGIPHTTPMYTIDRLCSSGLQACANIASQIVSNQINIGIGGGVESMSMFAMTNMVDPNAVSEEVFEHEEAQKTLMPMGITSENVAAKYGITREQQDQMAYESHMKAANAQKQGWSQKEITPYETTVTDKEGNEKKVMVDRDDGVRPSTTVQGLAKLKPAFQKGGSTTAGNSSQVTDGAAVVLMAKRSFAEANGLPILGRFVSYGCAGVPPEIMGIGPAFAIPVALKQAGLTVNDIDVFEVNEAFAS